MKISFSSRTITSLLSLVLLIQLPIGSNAQKLHELTNPWPVHGSGFYQGFQNSKSGTELDFFPFLEDNNIVLYLGENGKYKSLEFETSPIPKDYNEEYISFIWNTGIANSGENKPSEFKFSLNNKELYTFQTYSNSNPRSWQYISPKGIELSFLSTQESKPFQDQFGYMILSVPVKDFEKGKSLLIKCDEIQSNDRDYFMAIQNPVQENIKIIPQLALHKTSDGPMQPIKIELTHLGPPKKGKFTINGDTQQELEIKAGKNEIILLLEPVREPKQVNLEIFLGERKIHSEKVSLTPVRHYEVYFLPHSHVDIGFTHKQQEVAELQWRNLDLALDLIDKTKDFPDRSKYKWNAEISWVLDGYLNQASDSQKERFMNAVESGHIGIDALYGSVLTGLQREEELFKNTVFANQLARKYGFEISSAMITDVPGYTWGVSPSLAQTGIKYFSVGPNHMPHLPHGGYQVGHTFEAWGDVPFYWTSPSGQEKILFWMSTHGYSWFHSWLMGNISYAGGDPILNFLDELDMQKYPYDIVQLRYNIGNDNGPPDPDMPDFFKEWNEVYEWPKFRIATTMEMMKEFERRYADKIPEHKGDFSPYWEDGAASSAVETAINRNAADRLVQGEFLWTLLDSENFPHNTADEAWKNVVLFSEHTWGANISKSDPDSDFTKSLWEVKQGFALDAQKLSEELVQKSLNSDEITDAIEAIEVFNTLSWERSHLVSIPGEWSLKGEKVMDENGKAMESQRLNSGELVFKAENIPPLGSKKFILKKGKTKSQGNVSVGSDFLENSKIRIVLDPATGDIIEFTDKSNGANFINMEDSLGFNSYWYGGNIKENLSRNYNPTLSIIENGSLYSKIRIESLGEGSEKIIQEISIISGEPAISITNIVDKKKNVEDENVRFSFPFSIPNGEVRIDIPWTVLEPGKNQLKGANHNFYCAQRFLDISNQDVGITLSTADAPIWEIGDMNGQKWMKDMAKRPWMKTYDPSQTLFSWVMNNRWFVNYKAHQEGLIPFRYRFDLHDEFKESEAKKRGMEFSMPLIINPVKKSSVAHATFLTIQGSEDILVSSIKPARSDESVLIRVFNASNEKSNAELSFNTENELKLFLSDPLENKKKEINTTLEMQPWEIKTIMVEGL